jgi:TerC family integral membrane protein
VRGVCFDVEPNVDVGSLQSVCAGELALDLGVFHRGSHEVRIKESLIWSGVWIALALLFNLGVYYWQGPDAALEFLTGYLIERALSVDNLFVFLLVFSYFRVPARYQYRVLIWGIVGALVMRAIFIFAGISLIERFHWITYLSFAKIHIPSVSTT